MATLGGIPIKNPIGGGNINIFSWKTWVGGALGVFAGFMIWNLASAVAGAATGRAPAWLKPFTKQPGTSLSAAQMQGDQVY